MGNVIVRQSIVTKTLSPTNFRGKRAKATSCSGVSVTVGWDFGLESWEDNHVRAFKALIYKLKWFDDRQAKWHCGAIPDGLVFVQAGTHSYISVESFSIGNFAEAEGLKSGK